MATCRSIIVTVCAIAALALSACGSSTDSPVSTEPVTATVTGTITETATASSTTSNANPSPTVPTSESCISDDLSASNFGHYLDQSRIPLGTLGQSPDSVEPASGYFYFQLGENGYNSCSELSYVVLNGSNGDDTGPAGTGSSIADSLVLFHHGEVITNPAPFEMKAVESVERISDSQLEVVFGHAGRSTAEGVTEHYTFNFIYTDQGLTGEGELPDSVDGHMRLYLR